MAEKIGLAAVIDMRDFNRGLKSYTKGINKMNKQTTGFTTKATGQFAKLGGGLLKFGALAGTAALAGVAALGVGLGALGVNAIKTAISFESAFTGVTKTIDGLSDNTGKLTDLGEDIRKQFENLSTVIPATFEEIAAVGEIGGQLGVGATAITDFTKTVIQLRDTTNLTAEEAATALARIGNIYQVAADDIGENTIRIGSAVVALGNNFATTEGEIVNFATRLAGAGKVVGLSQADILGIGAAFTAVGVQAEAGGTATQKVLLSINNAVNAGASGFTDYSKEIGINTKRMTKLQAESARLEAAFPGLQEELLAQRDAFIEAGNNAEDFGRLLGDKTRQKALETALSIRELKEETQSLRDETGQPIDPGQLAKFARVAGISADEFKEAWQADAAGAFQLFVEGLAREGDNAANVLDDLGLADQRLVRGFLSLASAGDLLGRTLDVANKGFEEANALSDEAAKRYATTASKIQILKNTLRVLSARIGAELLPLFNRLIDLATEFITKWAVPIQNAIENIVIPAIDRFIKRIQELIQEFQAGGLFGAASGSFGGIGLLAALGLPPDAVEIVQGIFDGIQGVITGFQTGGAGGAFQALFDSESLTNALQSIIDTASQFLADNWPTVEAELIKWQDQFFDWVAELYPQIPAILTGVIQGITDFLASNWPTINTQLTEWSTMFWDWVIPAAEGAAGALLGIAVAMLAWATSGEGQTAMNNLGQTLAQLILDSLALSAQNQEGATIVMTNLALGLLSVAGAVIGTLVLVGGQIVAGIVSGMLKSIGVDLKPALFSELSTILSGIASNMLTAAKIIGTNIILGISQGILDTISKLITTIEQIGFIITQTIKDLLGISSPSTVFYGFGVDIVQGLINGAKSLLGSLADLAGDIFSSLIGGGGEEAAPTLPALTLDPQEMLVALESIQLAIDNIILALTNITATNLPLLSETFVATSTLAVAQLTLLLQIGLVPITLSIMTLYGVHLPTLQSTMTTTAAAIIASLTAVNNMLDVVIATINIATSEMASLGATGRRAGEDTASAFKTAAQKIKGEFVNALKAADRAAQKLEASLRRAAEAARSVRGGMASSGIGFSTGIGFQAGIGSNIGNQLGLGYRIPPGFANDSFGPFFAQSGEEMLITPRGTSIEGLVFSRLADLLRGTSVQGRNITNNTNYNFDMTVNTGSSPVAVIQQFEVMQGLLGA